LCAEEATQAQENFSRQLSLYTAIFLCRFSVESAIQFGTSLTFASPVLSIALQARGKKYLRWAAWTEHHGLSFRPFFYSGTDGCTGKRYSRCTRLHSDAHGSLLALNLLAFPLISFAYDAFVRLGLWGEAFAGYLLN
jgi:hypothetical protein